MDNIIDIEIAHNPYTNKMSNSQLHILKGKWNLYHHLPSNKDWTLSGYTMILSDIESIEQVVAVHQALSDKMIKFSMFFYMRKGISPLWEDPKNIHGGCFSYKVVNKHVLKVWKDMMYLVSGEMLALESSYNEAINGITISPKKNFCIIKIWMSDSQHQDPKMIADVENLTKHGSLFKAHGDTSCS